MKNIRTLKSSSGSITSSTALADSYAERLRSYYQQLLTNKEFYQDEIQSAQSMLAELRRSCQREVRLAAA